MKRKAFSIDNEEERLVAKRFKIQEGNDDDVSLDDIPLDVWISHICTYLNLYEVVHTVSLITPRLRDMVRGKDFWVASNFDVVIRESEINPLRESLNWSDVCFNRLSIYSHTPFYAVRSTIDLVKLHSDSLTSISLAGVVVDIPLLIGTCQKLKKLELKNVNTIQNVDLEDSNDSELIISCPSLQELSIYNSLKDSQQFSSIVKQCSNLKSFRLSGSNVVDHNKYMNISLQELFNLKSLEHLTIDDCILSCGQFQPLVNNDKIMLKSFHLRIGMIHPEILQIIATSNLVNTLENLTLQIPESRVLQPAFRPDLYAAKPFKKMKKLIVSQTFLAELEDKTKSLFDCSLEEFHTSDHFVARDVARILAGPSFHNLKAISVFSDILSVIQAISNSTCAPHLERVTLTGSWHEIDRASQVTLTPIPNCTSVRLNALNDFSSSALLDRIVTIFPSMTQFHLHGDIYCSIGPASYQKTHYNLKELIISAQSRIQATTVMRIVKFFPSLQQLTLSLKQPLQQSTICWLTEARQLLSLKKFKCNGFSMQLRAWFYYMLVFPNAELIHNGTCTYTRGDSLPTEFSTAKNNIQWDTAFDRAEAVTMLEDNLIEQKLLNDTFTLSDDYFSKWINRLKSMKNSFY
jgi:hypothetical protein